MNVLILGGSTYDHIVHLPALPKPISHTIHQAPFHEAVGSTGVGKALPLHKLCINVHLYTAYGNDIYGNEIEMFLYKNGIPNTAIIDEKGTERHINIMDEAGNRISMFITQSSTTINHSINKLRELLSWCDVVVLNIIPYCLEIIPLLKEYNKPVWTDLHDYNDNNPYHQPFIDAAQYIHLSSDNLINYRATMQQLIQNKELVICTHGKQGASILLSNGEFYEHPALPNIKIVDTNGAGDSFFAGFLYGFINQKDTTTCMQYGNICGAYAITDLQLCYSNLSVDFLQESIINFFGI